MDPFMWPTHAQTTFVMKFVEALCHKARDEIPGVSQDIIVTTMMHACKAVGNVFHMLLQASFWITRAEAEQVTERGHQFCLAYAQLVRPTLARRLCLYKVKPKLDLHSHLFRTLGQCRVAWRSRLSNLGISWATSACSQEEESVRESSWAEDLRPICRGP